MDPSSTGHEQQNRTRVARPYCRPIDHEATSPNRNRESECVALHEPACANRCGTTQVQPTAVLAQARSSRPESKSRVDATKRASAESSSPARSLSQDGLLLEHALRKFEVQLPSRIALADVDRRRERGRHAGGRHSVADIAMNRNVKAIAPRFGK